LCSQHSSDAVHKRTAIPIEQSQQHAGISISEVKFILISLLLAFETLPPSLILQANRVHRNAGKLREIAMNELYFAFAALILVAAAPSARADDSGHISINSLNAQLHRSPGQIELTLLFR